MIYVYYTVILKVWLIFVTNDRLLKSTNKTSPAIGTRRKNYLWKSKSVLIMRRRYIARVERIAPHIQDSARLMDSGQRRTSVRIERRLALDVRMIFVRFTLTCVHIRLRGSSECSHSSARALRAPAEPSRRAAEQRETFRFEISPFFRTLKCHPFSHFEISPVSAKRTGSYSACKIPVRTGSVQGGTTRRANVFETTS